MQDMPVAQDARVIRHARQLFALIESAVGHAAAHFEAALLLGRHRYASKRPDR